MKKRYERITPLLLIASSAIPRLHRLGLQSEWNDEALSVVIASGSVRQILSNAFHSLHPPGYYLLLHYWRAILGDSDFALRLLSAFLGILSVAAIYILGRHLFGHTAGLWAGALAAFMPFHLFYSQEIRMYALLFLLSTLAILLDVRIWRNRNGGRLAWTAYLAVSLLGLYSHYLFTLIVGALGVVSLFRLKSAEGSKRWRAFTLTHSAMAILYAPIFLWIRDQWSQSGDYWISEASLAGFLSLPLAFTVGHFLEQMLLIVGYGLILATLIITLLQAVRSFAQRAPERPSLAAVLVAYWLPVSLMFLVSALWTPLTLPRLMVVAVPGLYLFLAWGASMTREKWVNSALIVSLILVGLVADYNWLFTPRFHKPPAREAALFLQDEISEDEPIVYANDSGFRLFNRYAPGLDHRLYLDVIENDNPQVRPEVIRLMGGQILDPEDHLQQSFWLVVHQDFEVEEQEQIYLEFESQYEQLSSYDFGGIRIYRYQDDAQ